VKHALLAVIASIVTAAAITVPVRAAADADSPDFLNEFDDRLDQRALDRHADELGLDDATRAKIDALVKNGRPAARARREQLHRERERLRALLSQLEPELDAVLAQADVIANVESEALKSRLRTTVEIRALLTPEQRAMLVSRSDAMRGLYERKRAERLREMQKACSDEITESCSEFSDDPRGLRHCLRASTSVSPACTEQLLEGRGDRRGRPRRPF
jgi:Spy/CpxP family protein refolding chaperone